MELIFVVKEVGMNSIFNDCCAVCGCRIRYMCMMLFWLWWVAGMLWWLVRG